MCMCKILLRAMVILKVHGVYGSWEVRPAQVRGEGCDDKSLESR